MPAEDTEGEARGLPADVGQPRLDDGRHQRDEVIGRFAALRVGMALRDIQLGGGPERERPAGLDL